MTGQEIKDELYWKAARTYIMYKYRKTIMAIGFGLALLTAGGVYYYIKRREKQRQEKESKDSRGSGNPGPLKETTLGAVQEGNHSDVNVEVENVAKNERPTGRPGTPYKSLEEKDIPRSSPKIDYNTAGADCCSTISVSLPRKKSRRWTLNEILEHAPRTGKNSKKREEEKRPRSGSKPRSRPNSKSKTKSSSSSSGKRSKSPGKK